MRFLCNFEWNVLDEYTFESAELGWIFLWVSRVLVWLQLLPEQRSATRRPVHGWQSGRSRGSPVSPFATLRQPPSTSLLRPTGRSSLEMTFEEMLCVWWLFNGKFLLSCYRCLPTAQPIPCSITCLSTAPPWTSHPSILRPSTWVPVGLTARWAFAFFSLFGVGFW